MTGEWNAESYHRVSNPHVNWGLAVLEQLPLAGDEVVVDLGCGTGRLTARLLDRLPRGRVVAIDRSATMTRAAHEHLTPLFPSHVDVVMADATALLINAPEFRDYFTQWQDPWNYAGPEATAARLTAAGFIDVSASLESSPVRFDDAASFEEFITTVICRPHVACLTDERARDAFIGSLTRDAAADDPPFELDYWRLNMRARKPVTPAPPCR